MDIVFAGTPDVAVPALEALAESEHRIRAVLTRPDAPVGRKRVLTPSPVKTRALELGLTVIEADRLRGEVISDLRALEVDAVAVVAFGAIAGPAALSTARLGWYNLHFSLLPAYRGAAPVQRALIDGAARSGVSVFRIDEGMDTGPVLRRLELDLDHPDVAAALDDYARRGAVELVTAFDSLAAGTAVETAADRCGQLCREDHRRRRPPRPAGSRRPCRRSGSRHQPGTGPLGGTERQTHQALRPRPRPGSHRGGHGSRNRSEP